MFILKVLRLRGLFFSARANNFRIPRPIRANDFCPSSSRTLRPSGSFSLLPTEGLSVRPALFRPFLSKGSPPVRLFFAPPYRKALRPSGSFRPYLPRGFFYARSYILILGYIAPTRIHFLPLALKFLQKISQNFLTIQ